jgi:hypothetical protein
MLVAPFSRPSAAPDMAALVRASTGKIASLDDPSQLMEAVGRLGDALARTGPWTLVAASPTGERLVGALMATQPGCVEARAGNRPRIAIVDAILCSGASIGSAVHRAQRLSPATVRVFVLHDLSGGVENHLMREGLVDQIVVCQGSSMDRAAVAASA